jgi:hypothetical protein
LTILDTIISEIKETIDLAYEGDWQIETFKREGSDVGYISNGDTLIAEVCGDLEMCGNGDNARYFVAVQPKRIRALLKALEDIGGQP